jgi:hypothetical protein
VGWIDDGILDFYHVRNSSQIPDNRKKQKREPPLCTSKRMCPEGQFQTLQLESCCISRPCPVGRAAFGLHSEMFRQMFLRPVLS